jgi:alkylhydroperoxidase/carboxymuconolactone decarboxylase family protein YurZ
VEAGAKRAQIISAGFMAMVMHGGPALMYLIPLLKAVDEFAKA